MNNLDLLKQNFLNIDFVSNKLIVNDNLFDVLEFLKLKSEFDYDILTSVTATDYIDFIELIYKLYSVSRNVFLDVVFNTQKTAPSVAKLYKSAHFDECEIFDLFGVEFIGNEKLKRLYLPDSWEGHPMLKSYQQNDKRLVWNE